MGKNFIDILIEIDAGEAMEAVAKAMEGHGCIRMSSDVNRVSLNRGYALGSELSGGIRDVAAENCSFENVYSVGSIKAPRGRGNVIEDVLFQNHTLVNMGAEHTDCRWFRGAINIDMFYSHNDCAFDEACPVDGGTPVFRNITFRDIVLETAAGNAIYLAGLKESPLQNMSLIHIKAKGKYGIQIHNADQLTMENVEVEVR